MYFFFVFGCLAGWFLILPLQANSILKRTRTGTQTCRACGVVRRRAPNPPPPPPKPTPSPTSKTKTKPKTNRTRPTKGGGREGGKKKKKAKCKMQTKRKREKKKQEGVGAGKKSCREPGSNQRPLDLQSNALPTELSRHVRDTLANYNTRPNP